jgi:hypothetical protein
VSSVNDIRDELREVLQDRAEQIPPHRTVPRSLAGRARRRLALNALAAGVVVAALAAGTVTGLHAFTSGAGEPAEQPSALHHRTSSGHPTRVQPSTSATANASGTGGTAVVACTSGQLRAIGSMEGTAGSREGGLTLTNFSDRTCTLQGTPTLTLLDQNLNPITSGVSFVSSPAGWQVNGEPQPQGWPVVTLRPGDAADVRLRWSNWCPDGRAAPLWRVNIPGSDAVDVANGLDGVSPPPCNGPGQPSTIEVGPFEPGSVAPSQPAPAPSTAAAISACTSGQLRANGSMDGAAGSREGGLTLTNFSDRTCTLQGTPTITLLDQNLNPITSGVSFVSSPAGWQANAQPQPAGWPVVTLRPGDAAAVRLRWSNWCPAGRAAPLWKVNIPGSGAVDVANGLDGVSPPCNGPGQPSTVEVGPFEPSTGP